MKTSKKSTGTKKTKKNLKGLKGSFVILISFVFSSCSTPKIINKVSDPYDIDHPMEKDVPKYTETSLLFKF